MRKLVIYAICLFSLTCFLPCSVVAEKDDQPKKAVKTARQKDKGKKSGSAGKGKKGHAAAKSAHGKKKAAPTSVRGEGGSASVGTASVKEMRYWSNPDYTRLAVTLDRDARYEYHTIPANGSEGAPARLYIDIGSARLVAGVKDIPIGDGLLKTARIAQYRADTVRVVLDLDSIRDFKVFTFSEPFRIIIDIKGERREELTRPRENVLAPLPSTLPERAELPEVKQKITPKSSVAKIRRIVVDPGHGGHDPGAIGARGTKEKDIVLQIGLKLAKKLREELGLDVVLTRSTDVFLELQERTAIANQVGADLFVSIHANASPNRATGGIETYYLNLAKTEKVAQLAAKENGTSLEKVSLLQAVLFDLMANYKLNDSARLADEVQKSLHRKVSATYSSVKNLGVKQGPFYVLVGATMPSVLVETAFLSNEREEERLQDPAYQEATAEGILEGIRGYVESMK